MPVRALVVSAVRLYRDGLTSVLQREGSLSVVGTAANEVEALALLSTRQPEVALVDVGASGAVAMIRRLRHHAPSVKVIALALGELEQDVLACVEAGIAGYVSIDGSLADLCAAVESAVRDELLCSPRVAAAMLRRLTAFASGLHPAGADAHP